MASLDNKEFPGTSEEVIAALEQYLETGESTSIDSFLSTAGLNGDSAKVLQLLGDALDGISAAASFDLMKYRLTSDALGIGLWDMVIEGENPLNPSHPFTWSDEFRALLGFEDTGDFPDILASWSDRLHPRDKGRVLNAFAAHLTDRTGKTPYDLEYRLKLKNGDYRTFHAFGTTMRDERGKALRVAGALQDIDEKVRMQQHLERSDLRLELLLKSREIALWDVSVNPADPLAGNNEFWWSDKFRALLGYTDENDFPNILSSWSDRLIAEDKQTTLDAFLAHLMDYSGNTPYDITYRLSKKDGEIRTFHAFGATLRSADGSPERVVGAVEDVTEQAKLLERLEATWRYSESGLILIDAETNAIIDVNPSAARLIGGSREELLGKKCRQIFCSERGGCPIRDGHLETNRTEQELARLDGEVISIIKSVAQINFDGREVMLESFIDISPYKEAEKQKRAAEIAEQTSKTKSAFLANISHEIRTPMNAIIGMSTIALESEDTERKDYAVGKIKEAADHLLGVINDVLDISKIESGKFELSLSEFDFEAMLSRVVTINQHRVLDKQQNLTVVFDNSKRLRIVSDEHRLAQVISNLLSNAVKFTPDKGSITLTARLAEGEGARSTLEISVADSGIGISLEQQSRLFQSFQQAESSTTRKYGGTGLGLAISKSIVDMMGGRISLESELNKGATFTFAIPVQCVDEKSIVAPEWRGIRILLVERDVGVQDFFREIIERHEATCDIALNAKEAFELISGEDYTAVFIDYLLPDLSGPDMARLLKDKMGLKAPVIILADAKWDIIKNEALDAGADAFIAKPVFSSNIVDTINGILFDPDKGFSVKHGADFEKFKGLHLLLVEDVEVNREIAMAFLEPTGMVVDCACNGKEALSLFEKDPARYDLILMDVQMPVMDGYEAARCIRKLSLEGAASIPIVALTANVFKEDIDKCVAAGMNGHIGKPINFDEMLRVLGEYL
ncbi:MAG: response regulator [Coriobacteriales bacterium]|jgi:PAS domain S-box-containing protein|nr:response regulator [Coriobacteriales bacterium]